MLYLIILKWVSIGFFLWVSWRLQDNFMDLNLSIDTDSVDTTFKKIMLLVRLIVSVAWFLANVAGICWIFMSVLNAIFAGLS